MVYLHLTQYLIKIYLKSGTESDLYGMESQYTKKYIIFSLFEQMSKLVAVGEISFGKEIHN